MYSFLCPNGTLFDQRYFVCDYWFNVDCSQAESLYYLNEVIAEERESNIGAQSPEGGVGVALGTSSGFSGKGGDGDIDNIQTLYGAPRDTRETIDRKESNNLDGLGLVS